MRVSYDLINEWQAWIKGGALVSEMESTALFTVCSSLRCRAGAVMLCVWNQEREAAGLPQDTEHDTELAIRVAIEGVRRLIGSDKDQH
jgi:uridine phosphorylase